MQRSTSSGLRGPGRPRSERSHQAIIKATNELLADRGFDGLTIEDVAQRAGVSKATIYRRWNSKGTLVFEAFSVDYLERIPIPDTGTFRGDLEVVLRKWIRTVKGTVTGRTLAALVAEVQRDEELAILWKEHFLVRVRDEFQIMIERALERGEVAPHIDPDVVLDLVFGSMYHRLLQSHQPLNDRFAAGVIDIVIAGTK